MTSGLFLEGKDVYRCRFCEMPFSVPSTLEKHMRKCVINNAPNSAAAAAIAAATAAASNNSVSSSTNLSCVANGGSGSGGSVHGRPASTGSASGNSGQLSLMNGLAGSAAGSGLLGFGLAGTNPTHLLLSNQLLNMVNSARNSPSQSGLLGATASNLLSIGYGLGAQNGGGNEEDA